MQGPSFAPLLGMEDAKNMSSAKKRNETKIQNPARLGASCCTISLLRAIFINRHHRDASAIIVGQSWLVLNVNCAAGWNLSQK